ncbi:MAG: CDP-glycerol glycerophosphotransferase family protein [Coriobacteriia bacterium]|nr:CDP-glycerol glycerophosphotransferase family protein [Coriobacteriia bacterium]
MKQIILTVGKAGLAAVYAVLKLFPTHPRKVVFLSRQTSGMPLDFALLQDQLRKDCPDVEMVSICHRIKEDSTADKLRFCGNMLRSMYHLATSQAAILDTYWPAVSLLNHKKDLTVIQIWHAIGKIKQSGYQTLGRSGGRSEQQARALHMHEGYDYIIAGAPVWNPFYCASFGCTEDKLVNIGLPRMDYLVHDREEKRERIFAAYPQLRGRTVVLYAPTFRRNAEEASQKGYADLLSRVDTEKYAFVVKGHPNQAVMGEGFLRCAKFSAMDLLLVADYLITDYSAITLEGAVAGVRTLFYQYDYDDYMANNGLNLDVSRTMPSCAHRNAQELLDALDSYVDGTAEYPEDERQEFARTYVLSDLGHATKDLADLVIRNMRV